MENLIVFGGVFFWILVSAFILLELIFVDLEKFSNTACVFVFFIIATSVLMWQSTYSLVTNYWLDLLIYSVIYLVIGTCWMFVKWFKYTAKISMLYENTKENFYNQNNIELNLPVKQLPKDQYSKLSDIMKDAYRSLSYEVSYSPKWEEFIPKVKDNKNKITNWILWWPFSMVISLFKDFLKDVLDFIYRKTRVVLQRIANHQFNKHKNYFL